MNLVGPVEVPMGHLDVDTHFLYLESSGLSKH